MMFRKILVNISIRLVFLFINLAGLVYFWMGNRDLLILLNLMALLIIQVYLFIRSQNQVNRKLRNFMEAYRFEDMGFSAGTGFSDASFQELYSTMDGLLKHVREINLENQRQSQYFQSVTEHAGVGILVLNENKELRLANRTLKDLLGILNISQLSDLDVIQEGLSQQLEQIMPGEQKLLRLLIPSQDDVFGEIRKQFSIRATEIRLEEEKLRILTFQNIQAELDDMELESWQKVIRVLTHEITNSTGPIASAAQTMLELIERNEDAGKNSPNEVSGMREDLLEGLKIIRERSMGMEEFVRHFRTITLTIEPNIEKILMKDLLNGILILFERQLKEKEIHIEYSMESTDMILLADRNLVEQLMINLVNNAIQALSTAAVKKINIRVQSFPGRQCSLSIGDTGTGIKPEDLDKIFIPFYTTKDNGSGIGLALVRNIMRMHRGTVQVTSEPGIQTTFRMIF